MKLIDADWLLNHLGDVPYKSSFRRVLIQTPSAIVPCPQCKYHVENGCFHYCKKHGVYCPSDPEYFCAYGEVLTNE